MTYRYVPARWARILQLATLLITMLSGLVITVIPLDDPRMSAFERTFMTGDIFGWTLVFSCAIGFIAELWMWFRRNEKFLAVVAWCHITAAGALGGYCAAAVAGILVHGNIANIGGPLLGLLLVLYHAAYSHRPRRIPTKVVLP